MTAASTPAPGRPAYTWSSLREDTRQFIAVMVVLAIALVAGLLLKNVTESQSRVVRGGGVSASVPADWIYQPGAGDVLFIVNDPRIPGHRYLVTRVAVGEQGLREAVDRYTGAKSQLHTAYQSIGREQVTIGGRTGEAVTYAFVLERAGHVPQVIRARDVFVESSAGILVISSEAPADRFDESIAAFDSFVRSVGV